MDDPKEALIRDLVTWLAPAPSVEACRSTICVDARDPGLVACQSRPDGFWVLATTPRP